MLDIQILRNNPDKIQEAAMAKGVRIDVHHILEIDTKYRELALSVQKLREQRNSFTMSLKGKKPAEDELKYGKQLKEKLEKEEHGMDAVYQELQTLLLKIPNPAKADVKVGKDDTENDVIRKYKEPTKFSFTPKDHLQLGEALDIIDVKTGAKVSGARFNYLKNEGVLLEFALVQLALETLMKERFTPVIAPTLIKRETMQGLGYMENGGEEDMFQLKEDGLFLVGTAEHALVPMHKDDVLKAETLPKRYVGFSSAFRREAGSYGKDTKGILRVHQFDKIEMVSFVEEGQDDTEHDFLLSLEEKLFQLLDIPYQVIKMCTGDLGFPAARKYDIEAWMPSQNKYREVTSVSTVTDFQSRRLNIRYETIIKSGITVHKMPAGSTVEKTEVLTPPKKYAHILNGTAFAMGRTIIAILENYQQEDGSIVVPRVLRKYIGKDIITPIR